MTAGVLLALALAAAPAPGKKAKAPDLVEATALIPDLVLDVRYATADNFTGQVLYEAARCLLRPKVAERLARAQRILRPKGYRLKVFDCYRPFSVQKKLWEVMPVRGLVAPPSRGGSNHNRGAAVDVSLVRRDGSAVEMPTEYDDFSKAARINSKLPSKRAQRHRTILQDAMIRAGFKPMYKEWWHFDSEDAGAYRTLDVPLTVKLPERPGKP